MDMAYVAIEAKTDPDQATGLNRALMHHDKTIVELHSAVDMLTERLALVLSPANPEPADGDGTAVVREPRSDAVIAVEDLTNRVSFACDRMLRLLGRIDL